MKERYVYAYDIVHLVHVPTKSPTLPIINVSNIGVTPCQSLVEFI